MQDFAASFWLAGRLVVTADAVLLEIIGLSLSVSLIAVVVACALGFPLGALVAIGRFRGRQAIVIVLNSLMGLPPVVVGLLVYMMLSNAGPLGWLELLYTPGAMIIAQAVLVTPIVAALSREVLEQLNAEYAEQFRSLCLPASTVVRALLWDGRYILMTVALAGFGRAIAEVGAVIIVGGNIAHLTRVMTTAIALETSRGDIALALALGLVLIIIALGVNTAVMTLRFAASRVSHA
jgi:tungstate transport system permease protein